MDELLRSDELEELLRELTLHKEADAAAMRARSKAHAAALERLVTAGIVRLRPEEDRVAMAAELGFVLAVDMGATNVRFLIAELNGEVLSQSREKVLNQNGPEEAIANILRRMRELVEATGAPEKLRAISIGVPSAVHPESGLLISANNLVGWDRVAMAPLLEREFGVPVILDNDVNMAAVGEHWRGCAVGVRDFIFVAIGTGIGSGVFINNHLYRGRTGSAGELYLMNVDWRRWDEEFIETGHVESYVSGVGIAQQGRKAGLLRAPEGDLAELDDRDSRRVFAAMRRGDPRACAVIEEMFTVLGVALSNVITVLDPEMIVLNGGLTKGDPNLLLGIVNRVVRRIHTDVPVLRLSALGDKAQIYGALWLGLQKAFANLLHSERAL